MARAEVVATVSWWALKTPCNHRSIVSEQKLKFYTTFSGSRCHIPLESITSKRNILRQGIVAIDERGLINYSIRHYCIRSYKLPFCSHLARNCRAPNVWISLLRKGQQQLSTAIQLFYVNVQCWQDLQSHFQITELSKTAKTWRYLSRCLLPTTVTVPARFAFRRTTLLAFTGQKERFLN